MGGDESSSSNSTSYDEILRRAKRSKRDPEGKQKKRVAHITLYRNGCTIEGVFREKSDPVNKRFLESLARGEIPRELEKNESNENIVVELKDKRLEDYIPPSYIAYGGSGRSLSDSTKTITTTSTITESTPERLEVDESKSTCRIQVQLPNRSRIVVKCNETSTVRCFRNYVAFVSKTNTAFELLNGFPPKPMSHEIDNISVKEAGLSGSRVIMRLA